jgi:hypothetical protein
MSNRKFAAQGDPLIAGGTETIPHGRDRYQQSETNLRCLNQRNALRML